MAQLKGDPCRIQGFSHSFQSKVTAGAQKLNISVIVIDNGRRNLTFLY